MYVGVLVAVSLLAPACAGGGQSGQTRSIVVLSADEVPEIVVPADAFDNVVEVTTTTSAPTTTTAATPSETTGAADAEPSQLAPEPVAEEGDQPAADPGDESTATVATTTTTTTTTEPPKDTIPLEEEEAEPGVKLMDALDAFNSCLDSEGWSFLGLPDPAAGADEPVNSPDYLAALILCNSRSSIADTFQEFQTSRQELDPDEIREQNEEFIELAECLRGRGWQIGDLAPDENGLLNPGGEFSSPDGTIDTDEIRTCVSEVSLAREQEGGG
ncbi:MAG TPA: hypothetical protein EYM59_07375 [Acidimicrobiia bacterium]|nr:hypothetical protein [Acidimicrobiia bacterium]